MNLPYYENALNTPTRMEFQNLVKTIAIVCCFAYFIFQVVNLSKPWNGNIEFINEEIETITNDQNTLKRKRLPNALIIGLMKGGTTMLRNFIFIHPDVKGIETGELNFFSSNFSKGFSWYINKMEPARDDEIVMEKSLYFVCYLIMLG